MLHQIGIGTLGPVFRTYEPTRDRLVAVKVFRLDIVPEQAHALAAALSRAVHASLFHPSIVEPLDAGVEGTLAYRAEEYVAAESLDVAMRHYAPAPIDKVLPFMTQLAGAIDFARAAGIGHGGLHPRDIFVTPDEARATGFGVVEALEQVGIRAPIRRPYSAPERIDGGAWSTAADVFSLAAITFELLTSKRPAGTGAQIGALPDSEHASGLHTVLARAMDDDPARRYASALAFAGALEAASQGRPLTDAVSQVVAIAAMPASQPAAARPEPPEPVAVPPVAASEPLVSGPSLVAPAADHDAGELRIPAHAGELEIEARLDPVHEALGDAAPVPSEPTLFSGLRDDGVFDDVRDEELTAGATHQQRFSEDFLEDQHAEPALRSPLEEEPSIAAPAEVMAGAPMFQATGRELDAEENGDRGRPAILPFAVVSVLMLLVGFAAGYFVGSRERLVAPQESAQADTPAAGTIPAAPPSRPATSEKAGNYSEQKVTAPASGTSAAAAAAPAALPAPAPAPAAPVAAPRASAPETARATSGEIIVRSQPSRAGVTVNGTWRGRTPLTLGKLAFGTYAVRVVQPGYAPAREEVTLNARAPSRTITTRLERQTRAAPPAAAAPRTVTEPAGFVGSLYVDSRPRGATVTIDGRSAGQTPLSVPELPVGSHVVRIVMEGKKPVTANPRVVAGKMERVTVSLEDK